MIKSKRQRDLEIGGLLGTQRPYGELAAVHGYSFDTDPATWLSFTGLGTMAAETTLVQHGSQSMRLTAGAAGNQMRYRHDLWSAKDWSAGRHWFRYRFYTECATATFHALYLFSGANASNYITINIPSSGGTWTNGWHEVFGVLSGAGVGGFNWNAITGIGNQFTRGAVDDFIVADSFSVHRSVGLPQFCFTIDDGLLNHADKIARILRGYGWRPHHAIITSKPGEAGYLTWAQIEQLYAAGDTIGSHTRTHKTSPNNWAASGVSVQEAIDEAVGAKEDLLRRGYERGSDVFVVPFGLTGASEVSQAKLDAIRPYFRHIIQTNPPLHPTIRGVYQNGANADLPVPLMEAHRRITPRFLQDNDGTLPFNSTAINRVISNVGTGVVMLHQLDTGGVHHTTASFITACEALKAQELAGACVVRSLHEVLNP